ncbi:MAG: TolC family protein [Desulfobacteraceae bacterium]|nr:MAG: TolC family protein [Desulfobacteraceae bacterium]
MKPYVFKLFYLICIAFLPFASAHAQTEYTLYELCTLANTNAETIKIAEEDLYIAEQEKKRALSVLIPRFTAFASHTEYKDDTMSTPNVMTKGIKLTQSFTLNGRELIALDVTKRSIEERQLSLDSIRAEYLLQISQAYFQILSAERFVEIAQTDVERLEKHKNAVQEKVNVGSLTKTALYRAQAELSGSKTALVRAQNGVMQAKAALKNLVKIDDDFTLSYVDIEELRNYSCTLDGIKERALSNRPEINQTLKQIEIAKKTVKYEKSDYWPTFSLEAAYTDTRVKYSSSGGSANNDDDNFYVTGELSFTLYDGGLRKGTVQQALASERKARNSLAILERGIVFETEQAFLELETTKSELMTLQDELKSADENFNAVKMQFQYGMADSVDIMDANTLLVTAQRNISDARYRYIVSVLNIIYTQGDLLPFLLKQT